MTLTFPSLLADMSMPGHNFAIKSESAPGSEAFVLMTIGFLAFLFVGFAISGYVLWRRESRPEPHRQLLMELEDEANTERLAKGESKEREPDSKPWERDGDWWKK
jgi:hypothetical protein